ncbi:hypothetical protein ACHAWF_013196, partial [Thalassiosira exigua]
RSRRLGRGHLAAASAAAVADDDDFDCVPLGELTPDDASLLTSLMASHARRSTVESALTCERLLKRIVDEVDAGNEEVRATTKMYTVAMDAWAKSQRRPQPGAGIRASARRAVGGRGGEDDGENDGENGEGGTRRRRRPRRDPRNARLQVPPRRSDDDDDGSRDGRDARSRPLPPGAAAQRAHRIHSSLVDAHRTSGDGDLAPSTISYNAAINAWSKSYHPSAGEMAELLLGEMMREWRFGEATTVDDDDEESTGTEEGTPRGNERVKPDVVTFTAVVDAWVKCTASAHDYHYERPPWDKANDDDGGEDGEAVGKDRRRSDGVADGDGAKTKGGTNATSYAEWKRERAAEADAQTRRAATRAKELLRLMIALGHYDPARHGDDDGEEGEGGTRCEPGMRPNCYTYSAVMNALAKSCPARGGGGVAEGGGVDPRKRRGDVRDGRRRGPREAPYDPAREAQDMLEDMIVKHRRYKERVGLGEGGAGAWSADGTSTGGGDDGGRLEVEREDWSAADEEEEEETDGGDGPGYRIVESKFEEWTRGSWAGHNVEDVEQATERATFDEQRSLPSSHGPRWYDPRPDELTFPPNAINYNSVLNAWSRASRYDPRAALRAESILLERMERPACEGGDDIEPDALSYSLVIHAWLRGCRGDDDARGVGGGRGGGGRNARGGGSSASSPRSRGRRGALEFSDRDRIERAVRIADRLEAWARRTRSRRWSRAGEEGPSATAAKEDDVGSDAREGLDSEDDIYDADLDDDDMDEGARRRHGGGRSASTTSAYARRGHDKARDLDAEAYNSILVAYSREQTGDHAASVMRLLDRMEGLADELDMPSVYPNQRSYNVALGVIAGSAANLDTSLAEYYGDTNDGSKRDDKGRDKSSQPDRPSEKRRGSSGADAPAKDRPRSRPLNPLYPGRAAEAVLDRMLSRGMRPDAFAFASVLNAYQRIPNGRLDAALAADAVVRGMESLHFHDRIDEPVSVHAISFRTFGSGRCFLYLASPCSNAGTKLRCL